MNTQPTLPAEIICRIFHFLGARDIVRLRMISKQFHDTSYSNSLWTTLYKNARLPRPPGPYPSQSVQSLERILVKSERLALSWTTQPIRTVSKAMVETELFPASGPQVMGGRWFISCQSFRKLVAHDIDSQTVPLFSQVLWENKDPISSWDVWTVASSDGPVIYIEVHAITTEGPAPSPKLLEFRVNDTSGHLHYSLSLDIPIHFPDEIGNLLWSGGRPGPFLLLPMQYLIHDTRTRKFYKTPSFGSALSILPSDRWRFGRSFSLATKTHVINFYILEGLDGAPTYAFIRALTVPSQPAAVDSDPGVLHISHEGIIGVDGRVIRVDVIRTSADGPVNGATNIRLLYIYSVSVKMRFSSIDLTLPKHTSNTVLPMKIDLHYIFEVGHPPYGPGWGCLVDSSDDGYARGLWWVRGALENSDYSITRFAIDASAERCTPIVGEPSYPRWVLSNDSSGIRSLDGARGRLGLWVVVGDACLAEDIMCVVDIE